MRLNELLSMVLPNLDLEAGRAKIFGKGAKERYVYFGKSPAGTMALHQPGAR